MRKYLHKYLAYLIITILWILSAIIIDPRGDFPLNDDWATGGMVRDLIQRNKFNFYNWLAMSAVGQTLLGYLFCLPFGWFSFNLLRILTYLTGLLTLFFAYEIIQCISKDRKTSLFGALILMVNPIFLALSFTFMTEVYFLLFFFISMLFYIKYLQNDKIQAWLAIAFLSNIIAVLIRQVGLLLPMAFAASYLISNNFKLKAFKIPIASVLSVCLPLAAFGLWLKITDGPDSQYFKTHEKIEYNFLWSKIPVVELLLDHLTVTLIYSGLFVFPVFIFFSSSLKSLIVRKWKLLTIILILVSVWALYSKIFWIDTKMPLSSNILSQYGIGPFTLKDIEILHLPNLQPLSDLFLWTTSIIGFIGCIMLISTQIESFRNLVTGCGDTFTCRVRNFLFSFILLYMLFLILAGFFDRYFLPLIVPFIGLVIIYLKEKKTNFNYLAYFIIFLYGFFSVQETHNYFSWNRCRWEALKYLTEDLNVPADSIDGGFEFNASVGYDENLEIDWESVKSWWWVKDDTYVISFGEIPGYSVFKQFSYSKMFDRRDFWICILKKKEKKQKVTTISEVR